MIKNRVRKTAVTLGMDRSHSVSERIRHVELARKAVQVRFDLLQEGPTPLTVAHEVELGCKRVN